MRLYEGTLEEFKDDVGYNRIADKITKRFEDYYKRKPEGEKRAWENSLPKLKEVFDRVGLSQNYVFVEYELPFAKPSRIDVILLGKNKLGDDNIIIIELKQWSNEKVADCEDEGNVIVDYGRFKKSDPHPCQQVEGYYWHLKDYMSIFDENRPAILNACVYCHNYNKGLISERPIRVNNKKEIKIDDKIIRKINFIFEKFGKDCGFELEKETLKMLNLDIKSKKDVFGKRVVELIKTP